jgi:hypothetical protein
VLQLFLNLLKAALHFLRLLQDFHDIGHQPMALDGG